jgi:hypothetical protein
MTNLHILTKKYTTLLNTMGDKDYIIKRYEKTLLTMILHSEECAKAFEHVIIELEKEKNNVLEQDFN